jgi:hypothetical protein
MKTENLTLIEKLKVFEYVEARKAALEHTYKGEYINQEVGLKYQKWVDVRNQLMDELNLEIIGEK